MAVPPFPPRPVSVPYPVPSPEQIKAVRLVEAYLTRAGTHIASRLLGRSAIDREAAVAAELSNALRGTALCASLSELVGAHDHPDRS